MANSDDLLARMRRLHPKLIDLSLGRIEKLLAKLGNPQNELPPVVHIAGTNGKGSTAAFLKAMLEAAGQRVHAYTSPHLVRFHERISLANSGGRSQPISEEMLARILSRTLERNDGDPITFFEITTAAAFIAFAEQPADIVLLEVGLGGRFDTTNVIERPALSVITPISIDHTDLLGDALHKIAREKAGILKPGVPAIIAEQRGEALRAIEAAAADVGAPLQMSGRDFDAYEQNGRLVYQGADILIDLPLPALPGRHQIDNAGLAIAGALALAMPGVNEAAIEAGLKTAVWPARLQRLDSGPLLEFASTGDEIWLDGGHNEAAGRALAQALAELEERAPKPLVLICAMMRNKDAAGFMAPFRGLARHVIALPVPGEADASHAPRALAEIAIAAGIDSEPARNVKEALARAPALVEGPLRILICGSLYLAGHVLALHEGVAPQRN